ncbi:MAG TPA: SDR family oxidoreductase [Candidatus Dormibacteraeota bacterium]|nr:SDR family oxidoreductase [Candidatus Dormibacteraeota bacterium]
MNRWQGQWALITGASAGIGWALAELLAKRGTKLVLTARRRERLESLAGKLASEYGATTEIFPVDLAKADGAAELFAFTEGKGIEIDLLVNNAGFGSYGEFHRGSLDWFRNMVQVNVTAVVELTHLYLAGMVARRRGDVMIVASTAAFQPVPYISCYAATKGFDLLFAEGLAEEVRQYGVRVMALCPGSTDTEFMGVAKQPERHFRFAESAEKVAQTGLNGLEAGKTYVISGWLNYLQTHAERLAPRPFVARSAAALLSPSHTDPPE